MGFFTRKDSPAIRKGESRRAPVSSEIQAAELRARARRRLAGSIILVLAAVIVLPMVLDSRPASVADDVSVSIPGKDAPYQPVVSDPQQPEQQGANPAQSAPSAISPPPQTLQVAPAPQADAPAVIPEAPTMAALQRSPGKPESAKPETIRPAEPKPQETKPAAVARSDDGAVAMALLEGRKPPVSAAAAKSSTGSGGSYVLQIAAYGTAADAQSRYTQLRQSGITNAYVEPYAVGGKSQYRLRVGPFPSREAAQAAQARLRALGYDNGFIATK